MIPCAVISDVHGNLEALEAVLGDIRSREIDTVYFLGDAVGYGPNPNECIERLQETCGILLAGNHDWAAIGRANIEYFNEYARSAILWTKENLSKRSQKIVRGFRLSKRMSRENLLLVHATPKEPNEWNYLLTLWDAEINFHYFNQKICLLGHSHIPFVIERSPSGEMVTYKGKATLRENERYIVNAGSVGQPRDLDPRACYTILGHETVEFVRVEYNIQHTQEKMREAGLPLPLVERLLRGA